MPTVFLSPLNETTFFIPGGNIPANGAQLFVYQAGSSTKVTVYKDSGGSVSHTNPIVLNSGGSPPNNSMIWIPTGTVIDLVLAPSNDTDPPASPYWTKEDLSGVNDVTTQEWTAGPTPTFVNSSSFTLNGDQTNTFTASRELKFSVTAGTVYGKIANSGTATGSTTVNVAFRSGSLDSGLTAVSYSLISANNPSVNADYIHRKAPDVASAGNGTTNIWGISGDYVHVTGTNTIASFSTAPYAGAQRTIIFDGALTLQTSAAFLTAPCLGQNLTTQAGDKATVLSSSTAHSVVTTYQRFNGGVVQGASQAQQETGTTTGFPVTPSVQHHHPSAGKFWVKADANGAIQASYNVASIVDGGGGLLIVVYSVPFSSANYVAVGNALTPAASVRSINCSTQTVSTSGWVCVNSADGTADPSNWLIIGMGDL